MTDLHQNQPVYSAGTALEQADAAMILLHGRGASAHDILTLTQGFDPGGVAYLAPQAAGSQWYPNRFIAPLASNEPWFSSAIAWITQMLAHVQRAGLPLERIFLLGFSQGACLALEYAARHPQRYGGVFGLSGALIENGDQPRSYEGSLAGAPVFLGCSDVDMHVPLARFERTAEIFRQLGASVTKRVYPGMGHTVNEDELAFIRQQLSEAVAPR
ncbi:MAG: phospholipase [Chloroflexi bacterium]|nr:MAG: phospholipase [Chloroflexota bacterium]